MKTTNYLQDYKHYLHSIQEDNGSEDAEQEKKSCSAQRFFEKADWESHCKMEGDGCQTIYDRYELMPAKGEFIISDSLVNLYVPIIYLKQELFLCFF